MLALGTAVVASLALAATLWLAPAAPWRAPLALFGGVWAPGFALLAALYPPGRLTRLERHALAIAAGICLLPLLVLLTSETVGLRAAQLATLGSIFTGALALVARRHAPAPEPATRSAIPSTPVTLAICAIALVAAAGAVALGARDAPPVPASLALSGPDGPLALRPALGEDVRVLVEARAGDAPAAGTLLVRLDGTVVVERALSLAPHEAARVEVSVPTDARGPTQLVATWLDRETHATFHVEAR